MVFKRSSVGFELNLIDLQRLLDPPEAMALRRSRKALTADEAKALLAVKRVFGDAKIIYRGPAADKRALIASGGYDRR